MHLLFLTRKVDRHDPLAGFTWRWVREFGYQLSVISGQLTVVTWQEGSGEGLPENVKVYAARSNSLQCHPVLDTGSRNKNKQNRLLAFVFDVFFWIPAFAGMTEKVIRLVRFTRLIGRLGRICDVIFVHQHPIYAILAAPLAKLYGRRIYLWYVHKQVDFRLKSAVALVDGVFTASQESFRLPTDKPVYIVGHGIDTDYFRPALGSSSGGVLVKPWLHKYVGRDQRDREDRGETGKFCVVSVGRISPVKGYEVLIEAIDDIVGATGRSRLQLRIVGGLGLSEHGAYLNQLKDLARQKRLERVVAFVGPVEHDDIIHEYQRAGVFVNLSDTGSLDKAVLEAMACGVPVVTSNEAFRRMLASIDENLYVKKDARAVAEAILRVYRMSDEARLRIGERLRAVIVQEHNLTSLVRRIISIIHSSRDQSRFPQ